MKMATALECALVMSGKYDVPGKTLTVMGRDEYGNPVKEIIPEVDSSRLAADLKDILQALISY